MLNWKCICTFPPTFPHWFYCTKNAFDIIVLQVNSTSSNVTVNYDKSVCKKSPEIYDLVRFQQAIMVKYMQTKDQHFMNMYDALTPQIEEKIRAFKKLKWKGNHTDDPSVVDEV